MVNDTLPNGDIITVQSALDSLWKVQFHRYPYQNIRAFGWSKGGHKPSLKQQGYIFSRYGVRGYNQNYYCDSSCFKLLRDVTNPQWIAHYSSLY